MDDMKNEMVNSLDGFVGEIKQIIDSARANAVRSVDLCRVQMYWNIGKRIFEKEQQGKERADYGSYLIKNLSKRITPDYGSGFSVRQLVMCRHLPDCEYSVFAIELVAIQVANSHTRHR